jgi:hypothetical protein
MANNTETRGSVILGDWVSPQAPDINPSLSLREIARPNHGVIILNLDGDDLAVFDNPETDLIFSFQKAKIPGQWQDVLAVARSMAVPIVFARANGGEVVTLKPDLSREFGITYIDNVSREGEGASRTFWVGAGLELTTQARTFEDRTKNILRVTVDSVSKIHPITRGRIADRVGTLKRLQQVREELAS